MTASAPDLHDACVLEFGKDGKPKRVDVRRSPPMGDTMWFQNREVRVSRVFSGTRIVLRGADAAREPACSASNAPNIG
jgi:peroxiredoxin